MSPKGYFTLHLNLKKYIHSWSIGREIVHQDDDLIYPWTEDQVTKIEETHSKDVLHPIPIKLFPAREWATELEVNNSNILKAIPIGYCIIIFCVSLSQI